MNRINDKNNDNVVVVVDDGDNDYDRQCMYERR